MNFKQRLLFGDEPLFGAFLNIPSTSLVEIIGIAGYDYCIIDSEHGEFNSERIEDCLRAATSAGIPCIVRIAKLDSQMVQAALDMGADGIQVPQVDNALQAKAVVEYSNFPPRGVRGYGSNTRDAKYGFLSRSEAIEKAAQEKVVIIQIESVNGMENLAEILDTPGIDVIFIGTGDLSLNLGYDKANDTRVLDLIRKVVPKIQGAGKVVGVHITDWSWLDCLIELGVRYFTVSAVGVIKDAFKLNVEEIAAKKVRFKGTRSNYNGE
ncbi:aldolase/citrate lyase family protein [Desulfosporosinus sp. PR]|uniref:HpcH/HpaI aldolase family protein n=1 Tax=Candidatus Desulfosporosinus nitrosoreducens TaxID=3401928 RepID=UPI0027F98CF5|nr:aldolase/citrate lyase family protein [Desulfosporosinus sp. PR]MDQ7095432.1 aldolase/citrate lyase family protein [Desulfosporosinus sp. PR]